MPAESVAPQWRQARRDHARELIVEAAWAMVREEGLTALSLRRLAARAGITTPTVYAYFESKNAIYDAMFHEAAAQFEAHMAADYPGQMPHEILREGADRFLAFCTSDPVRYQLLFQRVLPNFEPSAAAYQPAVRALDNSRSRLRDAGVTDPRHVDLWTALTTGLASQQIANDPGGRRWVALSSEATEMFLAHCRAGRTSRRRAPEKRRSQTKENQG